MSDTPHSARRVEQRPSFATQTPDWSEFIVRQLMLFVAEKLADFESRFIALRTSDDLRYQQRFDAQQKGLETASVAAEKAVNAALSASDKTFAVSLASADRAIEKAEAAQSQHNLLQNEWRQTVNDITRTVAETARIYCDASVGGLRSVHDAALTSLQNELATMRSRVDKAEGSFSGIASAIAVVFGAVSLVLAVASLFRH